jgi:hypothetical protein
MAQASRRRRFDPLSPKVLVTTAVVAGGLILIARARGGAEDRMHPALLTYLPTEPETASGTIVREFPPQSGGDTIDARDVVIGPIVDAIPEGMILLVDAEIITPSRPAAIPGAAPVPCAAVGEEIEFRPNLKARRREAFYKPGCDRLQKTWGGDYDVRFPDFRLRKRADGISLVYTWIRWRREQSTYYDALPHKLHLEWELLSA